MQTAPIIRPLDSDWPELLCRLEVSPRLLDPHRRPPQSSTCQGWPREGRQYGPVTAGRKLPRRRKAKENEPRPVRGTQARCSLFLGLSSPIRQVAEASSMFGASQATGNVSLTYLALSSELRGSTPTRRILALKRS